MKKAFLFLFIMFTWLETAFAQDPVGYMDDGMHYMHFWGAGLIMWLPLIVIAVLLIYYAVMSFKSNDSNKPPHETPLDVLKKRYARGEITKEQFDQIKKDM